MTQEMTKDALIELIRSEARNAGLDVVEDAAQQMEKRFRELEQTGEHKRAASVREHLFAMRPKSVNDLPQGCGIGVAETMLAAARSLGSTGNRLNKRAVVAEAKSMGFGRTSEILDSRVKAMDAGDFIDGGSLIPEDLASDFIAYLRGLNVVRQLGAQVVQMPNGKIDIGVQDGTSTAYWVGEGQAATESQLQTGRVVLQGKKLAILTAISNDLVRARTIPMGITELVRNDLIGRAATAEDQAFLEGSGTAYTPNGIFNQMASGNKFNANGTFNTANAISDLVKAIYKVQGANIPQDGSWAFCGHPRTRAALMSLRTSDGYPVFMDSLMRGELLGYRAAFTTNIGATRDDTGSATDDETRLYFGAWSQAVIGDTLTLDVRESDTASFLGTGSTVRHAFSEDLTVMRLIHEVDIALRYTSAFSCIKGIDWGASFDS